MSIEEILNNYAFINYDAAEEAAKDYLQVSLEELYKECEHGDEEHCKWLKDKFDDFYKRKIG